MGTLQHSEEQRSTSATKETAAVAKEASDAKRTFLQKVRDFIISLFN